ncbi:MAG: hypothetical protein ABJA60_05655, partial [Nitrosospira sp.]
CAAASRALTTPGIGENYRWLGELMAENRKNTILKLDQRSPYFKRIREESGNLATQYKTLYFV